MNINHLSSLRLNLLTSPARRPSAELMAQSLRDKGVTLADSEIAAIGADVKRLNALHQLDFAGGKTAFEHLETLASAGALADGSSPAPLAADLFSLAGSARTATFGKCYARTSHTIFSVHHTGEMNRIISELAVKGTVTLADGTIAKWNPANFPLVRDNPMGPGVEGPVDRLWGGLNHLLTKKEMPANAEIFGTTNSAFRGEMANSTSRLMGPKFVNVKGSTAVSQLTEIIDSFGPLPAEFGNHGGSVAEIANGTVRSQEAGELALRDMTDGRLGYVVVPLDEAKARGLEVVEYPADDDKGYATISKPDAAPAAVADAKKPSEP